MTCLLFQILFSEYRWYRQLCGGRWMRSFIDSPVCSCLWMKVPDNMDSDYREPLWRGTPTVEVYV